MNRNSEYLQDYITKSRGELVDEFGILLSRGIEERRKKQKMDKTVIEEIEAKKDIIRRLLSQKNEFMKMIRIGKSDEDLIKNITRENQKLSIQELSKKISKLEEIMKVISYYGGHISEYSLEYLEKEFSILIGLLEKKKELFIKSPKHE